VNNAIFGRLREEVLNDEDESDIISSTTMCDGANEQE
jgi:hypothetical protein